MGMDAKAKMAIGIGLVLASAVVLTVAGSLVLADKATSFDKDPGALEAPGFDSGEKGDSIDWDYWRGVNPDIVGWITVPGTRIDYPVMQGPQSQPDYYLSHDVYGSWNYHGTPYLAWECHEGGLLGSGNALVAAHHLQDGTMFSALTGFIDPGFAAEHSPITIQTPEGKAELAVLAVDRVNADVERVRLSFAEGLDHAVWLADAVCGADLRLAPDGYDFSSAEHVVTLCTCSYSTWTNERTLVICAVGEAE